MIKVIAEIVEHSGRSSRRRSSKKHPTPPSRSTTKQRSSARHSEPTRSVSGTVTIKPSAPKIQTTTDARRQGVQGVAWSSVEDACSLCKFLDGKVISIDHPDFPRFIPPLHDGCRCIRVYILDEEEGVEFDWETPPADLLHDHIADYDATEQGLDPLFNTAVERVLELQAVSVSIVQRELKTGYSRAARIVDQMEHQGVVGKLDGSNRRNILVSRDEWEAEKLSKSREYGSKTKTR